MSTDDALDAATEFLGPKYKDMGDGRYLSADGTRQVRMGDGDILHKTPHINFEEITPNPKRPGTMTIKDGTNVHVQLSD
jgi:hypothetical protein